MTKQKYYVVWKGRQAGIFLTWQECSAQVTGFTGARYQAFPDQASAQAALKEGYEAYRGRRVPSLNPAMLALFGAPIEDSYCVDAACSGYPGVLEYRCVHTTSGEQIFHQGPFENGSANVGEFLAIVHALALFRKREIAQPVYTDSVTALKWLKRKKCRTRLPQDAKNAPLFDLIRRAEAWLQANPYPNEVLKWETGAWGEIRADFGRK